MQIQTVLDFLFYIFIYPIESLMRGILTGVFTLAGDYGVSIILLSLIINILILPLYYLAEHLKTKNQEQLKILKPKIDFFKQKFKGQQRHHYLQTLYKIHQYHPLSGVKASFGLLLQIPFFFAAFHLLGNYSAFEGVGFGLIKNLNRPDEFLFGQNLLPILMTLVNLLSTYFYAKSMSKSDKYQLWGLSAIFLVLLYFESSALLLYWTVNNVFSLLKNWLEHNSNLDKPKHLVTTIFVVPSTWLAKKIINISNGDYLLYGLLVFLYPVITFYSNNLRLLHFDSSTSLFILLQIVLFYIFALLFVSLFSQKITNILLLQFTFIYFIVHQSTIIKDVLRLSKMSEQIVTVILLILSLLIPIILKPKVKTIIKVLIIINITGLVYFIVQYNNYQNEWNYFKNSNVGLKIEKSVAKFKLKNNVYFFLTDGFSGLDALKNSDLYDNRKFYQQLENAGFKTYPHAFSNYPRTFPSMKAIWEMKHHKLKGINLYSFRFANQDLIFSGCNPVTSTFFNNQYQVFNNNQQALTEINCKIANDLNAFRSGEPRPDVEFYFDYIKANNVSGKYHKIKNWWLKRKQIKTNRQKAASQPQRKLYFESNLNIKITKLQQQFVYLHSLDTVIPKLCNEMYPKDQLRSAGYIRQIKCSTKDILKTIQLIYQNDKDPLIVIMADHASVWRRGKSGWVSGQTKAKPTNSYNILQAFRWPKECQKFNDLDFITPVNVFKYVFACLAQDNNLVSLSKLEPADSYTNSHWDYGMENVKNSSYKSVYKVIQNNQILNPPELVEDDTAQDNF